MSYTTLYLVPESGEIRTYREYHNASRFAWLVWDTMSKLYLHKGAIEFMISGNHADDALQPVWDLWKNPNVPMNHRLVMASTFDRVMVRRENLPRLADAYEQYSKAVKDPGHILTMVNDLRSLANDPACLAACWCQTSVSSDAWRVRESLEDDSRLYDVSLDNDHWFLFDAFEEGNNEQTT